jgi:hypothetical protein
MRVLRPHWSSEVRVPRYHITIDQIHIIKQLVETKPICNIFVLPIDPIRTGRLFIRYWSNESNENCCTKVLIGGIVMIETLRAVDATSSIYNWFWGIHLAQLWAHVGNCLAVMKICHPRSTVRFTRWLFSQTAASDVPQFTQSSKCANLVQVMFLIIFSVTRESWDFKIDRGAYDFSSHWCNSLFDQIYC